MKKKLPFIILILFYFAGLAAGTTLQFALPYFGHGQHLKKLASDTVERYTQEQSFGIAGAGAFGISCLAYDLEGNCTDKFVSGFSDTVYQLDPGKYLQQLSEDGTILKYDYIKISAGFPEFESQRCFVLVAASPLISGGKITGVLLLLRDLKDLSGHIIIFILIWSFIFLLLLIFFHILNKKEAELDTLQRTYIASMNHELKSPITSIRALTETLLDGYVDDPKKLLFYYSTILKEANNLEDTVQKILELSKLQNKKSLYKKEIISADTLFSPVLIRYGRLCADIDIAFQAPDLACAALPDLYTSPELASRVLDLLLHNASKFTNSESGTISVSFELKKRYLLVCVKDNGCGIPAQDIPHIFDRFYQAEQAHNKSGSGLGLSIAKEITDGLGEKIWVDSQTGIGSSFFFTIETRI